MISTGVIWRVSTMDWRGLHNGLESFPTLDWRVSKLDWRVSTPDWRVFHKALEHCILQLHIDLEVSPH